MYLIYGKEIVFIAEIILVAFHENNSDCQSKVIIYF